MQASAARWIASIARPYLQRRNGTVEHDRRSGWRVRFIRLIALLGRRGHNGPVAGENLQVEYIGYFQMCSDSPAIHLLGLCRCMANHVLNRLLE